MTRRIVLLTNDNNFKSFVDISALTLTKLNYQVDISYQVKKDVDLIIIDFDYPENIEVLKSIRLDPNFKNTKIIGIISDIKNNSENIFKAGCDSLMSKKEFERAGNNILMY
jgi:CheY-like chemotaxis protein